MTRFAVWAPHADRVDLVALRGRHKMRRADDGWHAVDVEATAGTSYAFSLDGGLPLPDPRSPWQPQGVHGPSRTVDHAAFDWHDRAFDAPPLRNAVIYEMHVGTFTPGGTFEAAIPRLAALVDLGVTHVELMPVAEFPGERGWGYDGVDLYAPHHAYGGPQGLKRLVDACHGIGLAVILDVVYNHLGPDGNYLSQFGPYFTDRYRTPWGDALNFDDSGSDEVRRFVIDNALMWLRDYHVDGLRLDAVHAIYDRSALHLLEELADAVHELATQAGRTLVVVAESDANDPRLVWPPARGGYGLDAAWSDDFHHALHAVLTGEASGYYADFGSLAQLARALRDGYVFQGDLSAFRRRRHGRQPESVRGDQLVVAAQNHDQIGNRALGERLSLLVDRPALKIAAALLLTAPFVPMLFQGEEWASSSPFLYFTGHESAELGDAVRRGRQDEFAAFGWKPDDVPDPQDPDSFQRSKLDWRERESAGCRELLEWHRALIRLRHQWPELHSGERDALVDHDARAGWLTMRRGRLQVNVNFGNQEHVLPAAGRLLLASGPGVVADEQQLRLPPRAVAIVER